MGIIFFQKKPKEMYEDNGAPADSTVEVVGSKIRVCSTWSGGGAGSVERVDEYEMSSKELFIRKWRVANALGRKRDWEYEIGEADRGLDRGAGTGGGGAAGGGVGRGGGLLAVASVNPVFLRRDSPRAFVFRVRNLRFPRDVYQLSIDDDKQQIVLRTSNKKYFKRFDIPALKRLGLPLETSALTYDYDSGTGVLIMRYGKPMALMQMEMEERAKAMQRAQTRKQGGEAAGDCATQ